MLDSLLDLRFLPWLLLFGLGLSAIFVFGTILFHIYVAQTQLLPYNEPTGARIGFLEPTLAVIMLFTIAISWLRYGDLVDTIQDETARMTLLGRSALTLTEPQRSRLVYATADYSAAIADAEWPEMRAGARAAVATDTLQVLIRTYAAAQAADAREQVILHSSRRLVEELSEQREKRLAAARQPLSETLQGVLVASLGATLMLSWFFGMPSLSSKIALGILFSFSLGSLLMFHAVLAQAFTGPAALDASAYGELARTLRAALELPHGIIIGAHPPIPYLAHP
jgi:hypothetical protein